MFNGQEVIIVGLRDDRIMLPNQRNLLLQLAESEAQHQELLNGLRGFTADKAFIDEAAWIGFDEGVELKPENYNPKSKNGYSKKYKNKAQENNDWRKGSRNKFKGAVHGGGL